MSWGGNGPERGNEATSRQPGVDLVTAPNTASIPAYRDVRPVFARDKCETG